MTTCPRCGTPTASDAWFCSRCGLDLGAVRAAAGGSPPPVSQPPVAGAPAPGLDAPPSFGPPPAAGGPPPGPGFGAPPSGPPSFAPVLAPVQRPPMPAPPEATGRPSGSDAPARPPQTWTQPPAWATVQQPQATAAASGWRTDALRAPGHTAGRVTVVTLAITTALSVLLIVLALPLLDAQTWIDGPDGDAIDTVSSVASLVSLVIGIAYLSWCYKLTDGFGWLTGRHPTVGKIATIGWWFVPLANFVMPAVVLNGLASGLALPGRPRHTWLVPVWWIGFLLSRVLSSLWSVQLSSLVEDLSEDAEAYAATTTLLIAGELLSIVAGLALIAVIVRTGRDAAVRQRAAMGLLPWPPPPDAR